MIAILRELMGAKSMITSEDLANVIHVTSRTVRNDIKELDFILSQKGAEIKSIRGTGYELIIKDDQLFRKFLQEIFQKDPLQQEAAPNLPEERVQYLIKRLLLTEGFVKLDDIADELFISKSTLQNDLREVKKVLDEFGIMLEKRPNYGFRFTGDEAKLRYCISEYLFNREETKPNVDHAGLSILSEEEITTIRTIILEQIKEDQINLSDIRLNNLIVHIAIACRRIKNKNYVILRKEELEEVTNQREYEVAKKIIHKLEEKLDVIFPQEEIAYIAIHLLGTGMVANLNTQDSQTPAFIDPDIHELTIQILETVENIFHLGIKHDKELIAAMAMHLKPAINRFKFGMNLRNPMLDSIKTNYPVAFQAGIQAGMVIKDKMEIVINEHEIGYLALHIGAAMERRKMENQPKRCLIVCASGVGSARLLAYKLKSTYGTKIEVAGTTEYYKLNEYPLETIDFVISTIPISNPVTVPVIEVNTFLEGKDFAKIERVLNKSYEPQTFEYLDDSLVFLQKKFETREEVLYFLGEQLQLLGYVDESFTESVLKRETLSPTSFGNLVAIPHPAEPLTDRTFWAICTLQKSVKWGDKRVQFVCLLSVEKNSLDDLEKMYDLLGSIIDDSNKVQSLLKCKTYDEFIRVFLES